MAKKQLTPSNRSSRAVNHYIFFILVGIISVSSENFEFQLSSPMLITSLRTWERVGGDILVARARNGSVLLTAESGSGIMAVVQTMNLQDINDPTHKTKCHDYIKMSQISGDEETREICGNFESQSIPSVSLSTQRRSFVDKSGAMELNYVLNEKSRLSALNNTIVNFNVSFTPFTHCPESAFPFGDHHQRPCSMLDTFSCISSEYFCDGVVNCGFPGEYGLDEMNCPDKNKKQPEVSDDDTFDDDWSSWDDSEEPDDPSNDLDDLDLLKKPYDGYIREEDYLVRSRGGNRTYGRTFLLTFRQGGLSSRALLGCCVFAIFISLYCLSVTTKCSRRRSPSNRLLQRMDSLEEALVVVHVEEGKGKSPSTGLMSYYDVESDPAPSYDDCLIDNRPIYSSLSFECEHPPSYEEIKVHQPHKKL